MLHIQDYRKIVDELIMKHFPKLKGKKIILKEIDTLDYRAHVNYSIFGLLILISTQLRKFPGWKIKRILIHELCHLEIFLKQGWLMTKLDWILYLLSKKYRIKVEKQANTLMIKKGFGKLVLSAMRENKKRRLSCSLTEKQIKEHMKKLK